MWHVGMSMWHGQDVLSLEEVLGDAKSLSLPNLATIAPQIVVVDSATKWMRYSGV